MLQAIGGGEARSDMTTKHLAKLDERDHQLEQRMAKLRDARCRPERVTVSAAQIQRAVALFDPVWNVLLVPSGRGSRGHVGRAAGGVGEATRNLRTYLRSGLELVPSTAVLWKRLEDHSLQSPGSPSG